MTEEVAPANKRRSDVKRAMSYGTVFILSTWPLFFTALLFFTMFVTRLPHVEADLQDEFGRHYTLLDILVQTAIDVCKALYNHTNGMCLHLLWWAILYVVISTPCVLFLLGPDDTKTTTAASTPTASVLSAPVTEKPLSGTALSPPNTNNSSSSVKNYVICAVIGAAAALGITNPLRTLQKAITTWNMFVPFLAGLLVVLYSWLRFMHALFSWLITFAFVAIAVLTLYGVVPHKTIVRCVKAVWRELTADEEKKLPTSSAGVAVVAKNE